MSTIYVVCAEDENSLEPMGVALTLDLAKRLYEHLESKELWPEGSEMLAFEAEEERGLSGTWSSIQGAPCWILNSEDEWVIMPN